MSTVGREREVSNCDRPTDQEKKPCLMEADGLVQGHTAQGSTQAVK